MMDENLTLTGALFRRHRRVLLAGGVPLFFLCVFLGRENGRLLESVILTAFLWTAAVFDYYYGLIFDRLTFPMALLAVCFRFHGIMDAPDLLLGALAGGVPLLVLAILTNGGMGGGDVKLLAAGGIWLGWQGALLALAIASWFGGLAAIFLLVSGRRKRKEAMVFGPFLSVGIWTAFFFGHRLLAAYGANCFG